jgi:uncharacterized protein YukJ
MSGNNNLDRIMKKFGNLHFNGPRTESRKRKRMISVRKNNARSMKMRRVNNPEERNALNKKIQEVVEEAIKYYRTARDCLQKAEEEYMAVSLTATVKTLKLDLPRESKDKIIEASRNLVDVVKDKVELVKESTMLAKEAVERTQVNSLSLEKAEEERDKVKNASTEAEKKMKALDKAVKAVEKAVNDDIKKEVDKVKKSKNSNARSARASVRSMKKNGSYMNIK